MGFPSINHHQNHHNRYVPHPNNFPEDRPNLYPHHHIPPVNLIPPPHSYAPLVHPPPPPPLHVPPPPLPSYNPNFTFLDAQKHNRSPPRVSNQPYRFDYRTGSRSDPNMDLSHRNPIAPEDHHRRLYSPNPQSDSYYNPHSSVRVIPSSRFLNDAINDGYASRGISNVVSQEQHVFRGSSSNLDRYASTESSARILEDYVEKYEPRYMPMQENTKIRNHHGEEGPKWVMKGKKNELGHNDGALFMSGREKSRDYEHEFSKFDRVREGRQEFKQVQKKSVLLRIGKPNDAHRNRNYDQHSSKGYLVESNNSSYRCKDKVKDRERDNTDKDCSLYLDQRIEGHREHSPVDLDVSFKSNALVAKPVVTPLSPVSDNNYTQTRNRKIKRVTEFGSPLPKFSEHSTRSQSFSHGFDSPSSSEKAPKQLTDKDPVSIGDNGSLSGPLLDHGDGNGRSIGPLSFRLKKKRKLMNPCSSSFNFRLTVKDNQNVEGKDLKNIPVAHTTGAISFSTTEEMISSEVDKSSLATVSDKEGLEVENTNLHCVNSFGDACTENKNLTAQNVSMINDGLANDLSQQPCENEISQTLENDSQNVFKDAKLSLGVTYISATSEYDQIEVQKLSTESCARLDASNVSNDICNESVKVQEMITIADMNSLNSCSDEIIIVSSDNSDDQGSLDDVSRKEDESQLFESTSKQISFNGSSDFSEDDLKKSKCTVIITEDNATQSSSCKEHSFDIIVEDNATQSNSHKEHSFDKDALSEMVNVTCKEHSFDDIAEDNATQSKSHKEHSFDKDALTQMDNLTCKEHSFNTIAEDNATQSNSHKEHSFDKDALTEMVNLTSTSVLTLSPDHEEPSTDSKGDLPPSSSIVSTFSDAGKSGKSVPDIVTSSFSSKNVFSFSDSQMWANKSTDKTISNLTICGNDDSSCVKSVSKDAALLNAPKAGIKTSNLELTNAVVSASPGVKTLGSTTTMQGSILPLKKSSSAPAVPRVFTARSSPAFTNSRINKTANSITKPRTWYRSSSNPAFVPLPPKKIATSENSYIRSGNSLVRKGAPVTAIASRSSVYQLNSSGPIEARNSAGSGNKVNSTYSRVAGPSPHVVRPKTPPLPGGTKLPDCPTSSRDSSSLALELLPASPVEGNFVVQKVSEDQMCTSNNSENQKVADEVVTGNKIQYVKRKSNQLVAASCNDQSIKDLDKAQASSSSDSYYKRRKNQLFRTSVGDDSANTDMGEASKNSSKRQLVKGLSSELKHLYSIYSIYIYFNFTCMRSIYIRSYMSLWPF
ncbi:hypothetical protein R6Q59_035073 [Mikania micrantha]